ncbi:hypothetical protein [Nocardia sp. NPDC058480]|uniref:hypothetical protein n=1 Tax=Nocardia sp. NPDC058480 TaxID=3346522 RepID=UPI0036473EC5
MSAMIQLTGTDGDRFYASPFEIDLIEPMPYTYGLTGRTVITVAGRTVKCREDPDEVYRLMQAAATVLQEVTECAEPSRCQATTVDPTNVFRPSCAWCVLPNGHQGMHRAELTQDAEPAILEWLDSASGGEVTG